jgi:hypothetical protein
VGVSKPNSSAACPAHACENENGKAEREERGAISDWIFDLYVSDASPLNVEHALEVDKREVNGVPWVGSCSPQSLGGKITGHRPMRRQLEGTKSARP